MNEIMDRIRFLIPVGKENAIHLNELAEKSGLKPSLVKKCIQRLRQQGGSDIMSGNSGYWITTDDIDKRTFERMFRKQALTRLKTTKQLRHSLKENNDQMSLTDILEDEEGR